MRPFRLPLAALAVTLAVGGPARAAIDPADAHPDLHLIPWPKSLKAGNGYLRVTADSRIVAADDRLNPLADVLADEIGRLTELKLQVAARPGKAGDIVLNINQSLQAGAPILVLRDREPVRTTDGVHAITVGEQVVVEGFDYRATAEAPFFQVYSDGEGDAHSDLAGNHTSHCAATDVPIDGLPTDLKRRGLLDSTLVIWGGEFGRMPVSQGNNGRDHNPHGFMTWMVGAGIKGGATQGETDEFGHKAVTDRVSVHDLHATVLHLLGVDHKKLTYFHNGRQYWLTDVAGDVLTRILA